MSIIVFMRARIILVISGFVFYAACNADKQTPHVTLADNDTLVKITVVDGVNQRPVSPVHGLKLIDRGTSEVLTDSPKKDHKYAVHFTVDSIGNRPLVINSKNKVDIRNTGEHEYEIIFMESGKSEVNVGIDCRSKPAFQSVKFYDKDMQLLPEKSHTYTFRDIEYMLSFSYNVQE